MSLCSFVPLSARFKWQRELYMQRATSGIIEAFEALGYHDQTQYVGYSKWDVQYMPWIMRRNIA